MSSKEQAIPDDDPAHADQYPYAKMWWHITLKGWQVGSVVATGVVLPAVMYRYGLGIPAASAVAGKATQGGVALSSVFITVMIIIAPGCISSESIEARARSEKSADSGSERSLHLWTEREKGPASSEHRT